MKFRFIIDTNIYIIFQVDTFGRTWLKSLTLNDSFIWVPEANFGTGGMNTEWQRKNRHSCLEAYFGTKSKHKPASIL